MKKSVVDRYRQNLSIAIIGELSRMKKVDLRTATDIYYRSRLCDQIAEGLYGIDNMDYRYLVEDLIENEPELFLEFTHFLSAKVHFTPINKG